MLALRWPPMVMAAFSGPKLLPLDLLLLHESGSHDRCDVTTCQELERYITLKQHWDFLLWTSPPRKHAHVNTHMRLYTHIFPHSLNPVRFGSDQRLSTPQLTRSILIALFCPLWTYFSLLVLWGKKHNLPKFLGVKHTLRAHKVPYNSKRPSLSGGRVWSTEAFGKPISGSVRVYWQ